MQEGRCAHANKAICLSKEGGIRKRIEQEETGQEDVGFRGYILLLAVLTTTSILPNFSSACAMDD